MKNSLSLEAGWSYFVFVQQWHRFPIGLAQNFSTWCSPIKLENYFGCPNMHFPQILERRFITAPPRHNTIGIREYIREISISSIFLKSFLSHPQDALTSQVYHPWQRPSILLHMHQFHHIAIYSQLW